MSDAAANAPMFIEAFHDACESLQRPHPDYVVPDASPSIAYSRNAMRVIRFTFLI